MSLTYTSTLSFVSVGTSRWAVENATTPPFADTEGFAAPRTSTAPLLRAVTSPSATSASAPLRRS